MMCQPKADAAKNIGIHVKVSKQHTPLLSFVLKYRHAYTIVILRQHLISWSRIIDKRRVELIFRSRL